MAQDNTSALVDLIRGAKLSDEQKLQLRKALYKKRAPSKTRSGPAMHCKKGDRVIVVCPDGHQIAMTVWAAGSMKLRLNILSADKLAVREAAMRQRLQVMKARGLRTGTSQMTNAVERLA